MFGLPAKGMLASYFPGLKDTLFMYQSLQWNFIIGKLTQKESFNPGPVPNKRWLSRTYETATSISGIRCKKQATGETILVDQIKSAL
jgi:hypothetical protein